MASSDGFADPTDLDAIRQTLRASDPDGRLAPLGMKRIEVGSEVLDSLPEAVYGLVGDESEEKARVVLVADSTPIYRGGEDLKALVEVLLAEHFEVERTVIGARQDSLHADEEALDEAEAAVAGASCVVAVGSGTITDICKVATARSGEIPLLVVQTAASVDGYCDDVSVVLRNGVKRTVASRWPDIVLADLPTLVDAPAPMSAAGYGDAITMLTAPADWYLASLMGMDDSYHPAPIDMLMSYGGDLTTWAAGIGRQDPEIMDRLTRLLALRGISSGVTGTTAGLSGAEHLISHMLDLYAGQHALPLGIHGAQVSVAAPVVAAAWEELLENLDPSEIDLDACFPEPETMEPVVREAFRGLDPQGVVGEECWLDYSKKLQRWKTHRDKLEAFLDAWPRRRAELGNMIAPPEDLCRALADAGAPARFSDLDPPVLPQTASWAIYNCHLMRNRFTITDLLFFLGWWDEALVNKLLKRAKSAGGGL